jgi:hypothetical protein
MSEISFDDSIENKRIIYHHFLDGLINTKSGNSVDKVMKTLEVFIGHYKLVDKLYILKTIINREGNFLLEFNNLIYDAKVSYTFEFNYKDDNQDYSSSLFKNECDYIYEFKNLKKYLSFCIFPTLFNEHLSSSIIFIKDYKLYFFILNSGLDINYNNIKPIKIDDDNINNLYQLTKGIILCNDITNDEEFRKGIGNLKKILFINFFYKYVDKENYKTFERDSLVFNKDFIKFFDYMKTNFELNILFSKQIYDIKDLDIELLKNCNKSNVQSDKVFKINDHYYVVIAKNLLKITEELQNMSNLDINDINKYNYKYTLENNILQELKGKNEKIRKIFIKKIILYYENKNFYIRTQESGSCSWFAIYYSLILYIVIFHDFEFYKDFIFNINNYFYEIIKIIFTYNNFKNTSNFIYMKKLCSKFIDIGLIEDKILFDIQDIIYDLECRIEDNDNINNNYVINSDLQIKDISLDFITEDEFIQKIKKNFQNKSNKLIYFYIAHKLFTLQHKGKFFFKQTDDIILEEIIHNIDISLLKDKYSDYFIKSIKENSLHYINIYKETYNFDMTQSCPSYIFYFLPIILYYNNIEREDDYITLDFKENKNNLFKCCLVYFRLYLINIIFENISLSIENLRNNDLEENSKEILLKILILPLLNKIDGKIISQVSFFNLDYLSSDITYLGIFNKAYPKSIRNSLFYETFNTMIDNYLYMEEYLYDNPNYITEQFLIYNILRINENLEIKEKLIKFYCKEYYLNFKNFEKKKILNEIKQINILDMIIKKLVILLYKYPLGDKTNPYLRYINIMTFMPNFKKKINNLIASTDINNFIRIINEKKEKIYIFNELSLIAGYSDESKKNITTYYIDCIKCKPCIIWNQLERLFNNIYPSNYLKFLYHSDSSYTYLYHAYEENTIKYKLKKDYSGNFKIDKIYFNGYEVIKFKDINFPFKYLIPATSIYFIYKINDIYNISFIVNKIGLNFINSDNLLLGYENVYDGIYTFEINPNTMFFLNKFNSESANFDLWNKLCLDFQVNNYNILYIDFKIEKDKIANQDNTGYSCTEEKYKDLCHFNKESIIRESICYELEDFKLLQTSEKPLLNFMTNETYQKITESYKKLLFKISDCKINEENKDYWIDLLNQKKSELEKSFKIFTNYIKTINLKELLNEVNYITLQKYLLEIKIYNFINKVLNNIDDEQILCSLVKNYKFLFDIKKQPLNYKFELLFELISGNEILDEQIQRYNLMIKSYDDDYKKRISLKGGKYLLSVDGDFQEINEEIKEKNCENNYPLHHFMMGKGKSAIITPLLALYFTIIYDKKIYIIVPKHLVKQTNDTISDYINIFNIDKIIILSEDDIKYKYLTNNIDKNSIFLIDEFDSLIKPSKSNFNLIEIKNIEVRDIGKIIKKIIIELKDKIKNNTEIFFDDINKLLSKDQIINNEIFIKNILSIISELKNNILKINITWGIEKEKLYAIPYRNKDKPLEKSSFSSIILTIFLTYYYYIILNEYKIDDNIVNFIKKNKIIKKIFNLNLEDFEITINIVENLLDEQSRKLLFEIIEMDIFNNLLLPDYQYNTSFVDIINIDGIFKIGYSGTVNMNLPILYSNFIFNKKCLYEDEDEFNNIYHAIIKKSDIIELELNKIFDNNFINSYDALIDVCGYFYDKLNYEIALLINGLINRNVIFIDENDNKMIIINKKLEKYNQYVNYIKPFFYYDQSHTVGIDIKQDNYPILKGICIVDKYSIYSEVAQAMYRLRKLNLGHTISFILNGFKVEDKIKLFDVFIKNQKDQIDKEKINLNFQALKSDIRKKHINYEENLFMDKYKEIKFYYFKEELSKNPLSFIFTSFTSEEIEKIDLCAYELDINDIKNIIYEIDFNCKETNVEIEQYENTEIESIIQQQNTTTADFTVKEFNLLEINNFKNYDFVKNIKDIKYFNNYTFKIDDNISFLPNIFINNEDSIHSLKYYHINSINSSNLILVYFEFKKFLLIPRYMVTYLYNDFLMFDLNLYIINPKKIGLLKKEEIKNLEENNMFIKIINNDYNEEYLNCFLNVDNYMYIKILAFMMLNQDLKNDKIFKYYHDNKSVINQNIKKYFDTHENKSIISNLEPHFRKEIILSTSKGGYDTFFKKYLKYKNKYIQLKNKLI